MTRKYTYRNRKSAATISDERAIQKKKRMSEMDDMISELVYPITEDLTSDNEDHKDPVHPKPKPKLKPKTIKTTEKFDYDKLSIIVDNFDSIAKIWLEGYDYVDIKKLRKLLNKYLFNSVRLEDIGSIDVEYNQKDGHGRYLAKYAISMQSMIRFARHTIASEIYNDIDVVNAHPVILTHMCDRRNIDYPILKEFVDYRDSIIASVMVQHSINRETVKDIFLSLLNGGKKAYYKYKTDFLTKFKNEMEYLHDEFLDEKDERYTNLKDKRISSDRDYNHKGTYMNMLMQDEENKILMSMYDFYKKNVDVVLCYDGLMLPKSIDVRLLECEQYIFKDIGFEIKLKVKPMNSIINLEEYNKPLIVLSKDQINTISISINEMDKICNNLKTDTNGDIVCLTKESRAIFIGFLRQTIIHTYNGGKEAFYLREVMYDHITRSQYHVWNKSDMDKIFKNRDYINSSKPQWSETCNLQKVGKIIEHIHCCLKDIPRYHRSTFIPYFKNTYHCPQVFNEWQGFLIQQHEDPVDDYDYKKVVREFKKTKIYYHITNTICNNNTKLIDWTMKHDAHMFQFPEDKPDACKILYSSGGAGKDRYADFLSNMIGSDHVRIQCGLKSLSSNFNVHMKGTILCVFNEVDARSSHQNHDKLKHVITQKQELIEPKGVDSDMYPCFKRLIINTNYRDIIKIESDDRRYVYYNVSNKYIGNLKFFNELSKEIDDKSILKLAFRYYTEMDISKFLVRAIPKTDYKRTQINLNLRSTVKFLIALCDPENLESNSLEGLSLYAIYKLEDITGYNMKSGDFFRYYKLFCEAEDMKPLKKSIFKADTTQILDQDGSKRFVAKCEKYSEGIRGYDIDVQSVKKILNKIYKLEL